MRERKRKSLPDSPEARDRSTREMEMKRVLTAERRVTRLDLPPEVAKRLDRAGFKYGSDVQRARPRDIMRLCAIGPWTINLIFEAVGRKENHSFLLAEYREAIKT